MSDTPIIKRVERTVRDYPEQNVQGWERIGSLAGGVLMMGKGLRRGGIFGLVQLAIGGAVLARGITGHCSTKALLEKSRSEMDIARSRIEEAGAELSKLKTKAEVAAEEAVVNTIDAVSGPKGV
ncbi:YgaP family membrane protein [Pseudomonas abietaniphila]|uniref:Inner membrane protein YgaP-like transmembrane domain-containing protein n=1 Tax=Pseudomonas abietaniphila TaxID=89065 RepID=A0A1G8AN66_9PSED|nr:DUF2892 domain-containing protein [Pseudomonas abietaniphila]SDH22502.1 Protein of unknown function [Pseudomonas abietaniphila]